MPQDNHYITQSGIFYSCTENMFTIREHFVPEHVITHVYSGSLQVAEADKHYTIHEGNTVLFRKNHLARVTKQPQGNIPFRSISIFLTQPFLQSYFAEVPVSRSNKHENKVFLDPSPLLISLFNSIIPYYEIDGELPAGLVDIKLREAMSIIRSIDKNAEALLADFAEPGKIDLGGFMHKNFTFNIPNSQFAYLTGRSVATFKRDFQKIFGIPPQKWLQKKRLEHAHYLITKEQRKPSDVYLEVGFENLSHFSHAFRKCFNYTPSSLLMSLTAQSI